MHDTITTAFGTNVNTRNVAAAAAASDLSFEVAMMASKYPNPVTGAWEDTGDCSVIRLDSGIKLGNVGAGYKIAQNVETFDRLLSPFLAKGAVIDTAGSLRGGAKCWMLCKLDLPDAVIVRKADDRVSKYVLVALSHDGSLCIYYGPSCIRVVCRNTLAASLKEGNKIRIRHSKGMDIALQDAAKAIQRIDADIDGAAELFRMLAGKQVTETQIRAFVDRVFPPARKATPSATVQAAMDEWNDGPTSPDVATTGISQWPGVPAGASSDFASLLARPATFNAANALIEASGDVARLLGKPDTRRVGDSIVEIFERGGARGDLSVDGVRGTGWAAYNAMTEYQTHIRGANAENRFMTLHFQDTGLPARTLQAAADTFLS